MPTLPLNDITIANTIPELVERVSEIVAVLNEGDFGDGGEVLLANNATYAYGKAEADLNVNSAVSALLANNATYAFGKTEGNLNVNSAINALIANNASYLNDLAASYYLNATNLATGTVPTARLGSGTANSTTFLAGDQTWKSVVSSVPDANTTVSGLINIATQSFAGVKTFTGNVIFNHVATFNEQIFGSHLVEFATSNTTNSQYTAAGLQIRESGRWANSAAKAPRIAFHWGGLAASQIGLESSGTIAMLDSTGVGYTSLKALGLTTTGAVDFTGYRMKYVLPGTNTLSAAAAAMTDGDCLILGAGAYTQTVAVAIPTAVTRFAIIGQGSAVTIINYTNDTAGIGSDMGTNDAYRIQTCLVRGFTMIYGSATPGTGAALSFWGRDYNSERHPAIRIEDVSVIYGANGTCFGIAIYLLNVKNATINNCFIRLSPSGRTGYGFLLSSCMNIRIIGTFIMSVAYAVMCNKAADGVISGVTKHGTEDVQMIGSTIFICHIGVYLSEKATWFKAVNVEICRPVLACIYEDGLNFGFTMIDNCYFDNDANHTAAWHFIHIASTGQSGAIIRGSTFVTTQGVNGITCASGGNLSNVTDCQFRGFGIGGASGIYFNAPYCKAEGNVFMDSNVAGNDITMGASGGACLITNNMIDNDIADVAGTSTINNNPVH